MRNTLIKPYGIPWYRPEDYIRILAIMADAKLPSTYESWLLSAEQVEREMTFSGFKVYRAMIDPDEFPLWCAAKGMNRDVRGRSAFANSYARDEASRKSLDSVTK